MKNSEKKSEAEWDHAILKMTLKIRETFPELSKYMNEIPIREVGDNQEGILLKNMEDYYNSLVEMFEEYTKTHSSKKLNFPEYSVYPPSEEIYKQSLEESAVNPEDLSKTKTPNEKPGTKNEKGFEDEMSEYDLDVALRNKRREIKRFLKKIRVKK
ncbi:MAG: hypothetical protein ACI9O4_000376 [Chitinophagales bacterium]|jgi:hypothetical protein